MRMRSFILPFSLFLAGAGHVRAQLAFAPAAALNSAFVWRGLTVVNRPVLQPEVGLSAGPASLSAWTNIEPAAYRGSDVLTALAGRRAPGLTEVDLTAELTRDAAGISLATGAIAYLYTHAAGFETESNTGEVYGRIGVGGPLPLALAAYYDVRTVRGAYLELSAERPAPRIPALLFGARVGASFGESQGPRTSYFDRDGITHVELSAALPFTLSAVSLRPNLNLDLGVDDATRVVSADGRSSRAKLWLGVSIEPGARAKE